MNLKLFTLLFLVALFCMDDVDAWRRRRFRIRIRVRRFRRALRTARTIATVYNVARIAGAGIGKRSVDEVMPKIDLCDFKLYDLDESGKVDQEEVTKIKDMTGLDELDDLFNSLDEDRDGGITPEEFALLDCDKAFSDDDDGVKEILEEKSTLEKSTQ